MIIAGYILSVYRHLQEVSLERTPGSTPVQRRSNTQTQVTDIFKKMLNLLHIL